LEVDDRHESLIFAPRPAPIQPFDVPADLLRPSPDPTPHQQIFPVAANFHFAEHDVSGEVRQRVCRSRAIRVIDALPQIPTPS
jgi:hypothetical protein